MSDPNSNSSPTVTGYRFSQITDDDYGGVVWIVSILCGIYSILTIFLRTYIKRQSWGLDDWLASAATVLSLAQYIAIWVGASDGLGRTYNDLDVSSIRKIGQSVLASEILFIIALTLAKASVVLLIRRLFSIDMRKYLLICDIFMGLCGVWGLASILIIAVGCPPLSLMGYQQNFCTGLVNRWEAIGIIDSVTEILMLGIVVALVWRLQMRTDRKLQVMTAFAPRAGIVAFAVVHIYFINNFTVRPNTGVRLAAPIIYQQIELCYSLISCTVPNMKSFLMNFDTAIGMTVGGITSRAYPTGGAASGTGNSFQLRSMLRSRPGKEASTPAVEKTSTATLRPDPVNYKASIGPGAPATEERSSLSRDDKSDRTTNSEDMIIRRDVQWNVRYD